MASFFNLILDTLAPAGLSLKLNDGATYSNRIRKGGSNGQCRSCSQAPKSRRPITTE